MQQRVDRSDAQENNKGSRDKQPVQAGSRPEPTSQPAQHLDKPGNQHELDPAPRYSAPYYRGSGKLEGKVALITGGDSGIGRAVAVLLAREGANIAIVYLEERDDAETTRQAVEKEGRLCLTIQGDVKDPRFCNDAVAKTLETFGKLDVLVNNAGFQLHCDRLEDLTDTHLEETLHNRGGKHRVAKCSNFFR